MINRARLFYEFGNKAGGCALRFFRHKYYRRARVVVSIGIMTLLIWITAN